MADQIALKQIKSVVGATFDAKEQGEAIAGTDAAELVAGRDASGNAQMVAVETDGRVKTSSPDRSATGTISSIAGEVVVSDLNGAATAVVRYTGGSMQLTGQASVDGVSYVSLSPWDASVGKVSTSTTISINNYCEYDVSGYRYFKVGATAYTSGTATVNIRVSSAPSPKTSVVTVTPASTTMPVSGTVTANIGTSGSLALDASLTNGTQKAITRGGAKGTTTAADITSTASGANHQPIDVAIYDASGNQITSFGGLSPDISGTRTFNAASQTLALTVDGQGTAVFQINGTGWSGNIVCEITLDNSTWFPQTIMQENGEFIPTSYTSLNAVSGVFKVSATGATGVRLRSTSWSSGSVVAYIRASVSSSLVSLSTGLPVSTNQIGNVVQGTAAALSGAWPSKITDGTTAVAVKAASTAPLATDPALVVSISPNSSISTSAASDSTATGNITAAAQTVVIGPVHGMGSATVYISGTWGATLQLETSPDNVTWASTLGSDPTQAIPTNSQVTDNGKFICQVSGPYFRVRCSAYTSGTATIKVVGGVAANSTVINGSLPPGYSYLGKVKLSDSSTDVAVKGSSSAPVASDGSLVVSLSPNLPARSTCTNSNITAATSSTTVLAAATGRLSATFWNDSTSVCYLKFGSTASATSCNVKLVADAYYELPQGATGPYTGIITAIWVSANGALRVGEVTA